jgi:hypothetical protein
MTTGCNTRSVSERAPSPIGRITLDAKPAGERRTGNPYAPLCVQKRLACSVGGRPTEARVRSLVAWMAGWRETKTLKPIGKPIVRVGSESSGRNEVNAN